MPGYLRQSLAQASTGFDRGLVSAQGISRRTGTARTQLSWDLLSREQSGSVTDRKTEMCSIFDVYDKCVRKGVCVMRSDHPEKGTQLRLDTVCRGPRTGLLPHNTSHRRAAWSIALLTPTSVP